MSTCQAIPIGSKKTMRGESDAPVPAPVAREQVPPASKGCATPAHVELRDAAVPDVAKACAHRLQAILGARYELKGFLGQGGMGMVFLAKQRDLNRPVAIKVLHPHLHGDAEFRRRFCDEVHVQSMLTHPGILPVHELHEDDEMAFFVMQYIDGVTLRARLDEDPQPPLPWVMLALAEISSALAFAHQSGVVHRDVKPENILIDQKTDRFMLCDFGVAKISAPAVPGVTRTFSRIGTLRYIAPEQVQSAHEVDGQADQYALGILAYEMLAGHPPFDSPNPAELVYQHRYEAAESLDLLRPDVPYAIRAAIHRAIAKDPADRFESLDEFAAALDPGVDAEQRDPRKASIGSAGRWNERGVLPGGEHGRRFLGALALGVLLFLGAALVLGLVFRSDSEALPAALHTGVGPESSTVTITTEFGNGASEQCSEHVTPQRMLPELVVPAPVGQTLGPESSAYDSPTSLGDVPVVAKFSVSPPSGMLGTEFLFDASGSRSAQGTPDGLRVRWDWNGDGVWDTPLSGELRASHRFSVAGTLNPRLEVLDPNGSKARRRVTVRVDSQTTAERAIRDRIAVFVACLTEESLVRLTDGAYAGAIPAKDEALIRRIFAQAEDVSLITGSERVVFEEDGPTATAKIRLGFRQERTGEPETLELRLRLERDPKTSIWHLRSVRMP